MKTLALLAAAGLASTAAAQADLVVCVEEVSAGNWTVFGQYNGPILGTGISQIWSDTSVRITGNGNIDIGAFNNSYNSFFGPPVITGDNSTNVTFVGTAPGPLLGGVFDASNPLNVFSFTYGGAAANLALTLVGQNTAFFAQAPFGNPVNYQNADGTPGQLTFAVVIKPIPAPASAALLGLGGLAAARRRR
jgi:hypothetical protein